MGCGASSLGCSASRELSSEQLVIGSGAAAAGRRARGSAASPDSATSACALHSEEPQRSSRLSGGVGAVAVVTARRLGSGGIVLPEEAASGLSQVERGYQQLPLSTPLKDWDDLHVRNWLQTLGPALHQYTDMLCSPGALLLEWNDELLAAAGVANVFHRKNLLTYVRQLQASITTRQQEQPLRLRSLPGGIIPGSIDSPRGAAEPGLTPKSQKLLTVSSGRSNDSDLDPGSRTPARASSARRPLGGSSSEECTPRAADEKGGADPLAEYEQGTLEEGLGVLKALVMKAGALCPWPGDAAAQLLGGLLDLGERALINRRNWQQLNARAVGLLQLVSRNKTLQADSHTYSSLMHRLINTLKGIREYFTDFTNRNWLLRVMGVGHDQHMFTQLWDALGGLVSDASLGLQLGAARGQEQSARVLERLQNRQAKYDDEEARLRKQIEDMGGVEALTRDPSRLMELAAGLGLGNQLTLHKIHEAVSLLEADRSEGVHSLIPHPDLRVLWRKCFSSLQDVTWALWWAAFPTELGRVPVEQQVIVELSTRLADPRRRGAFERRLEGSAPGRISVVDLRRTVPADANLGDLVAQLTERVSFDGASTPSSTRPSTATGIGAAAAAAAAAPPPPPYDSLEPRCHLPPLDSDRFVGREEDVLHVAHMLMAGASSSGGASGRHRRRSSAASGGAGGGGGALVLDAAGGSGGGGVVQNRPHAVCVVAESGQGKSTLAVAAARRLWDSGSLPGGVYHVDLQGADCRAELAARFVGALGVAKAEHDEAGGTAGVSLALQALAARGALLLVLDGVDCLDDMYGTLGSDVVAALHGAGAAGDDDGKRDGDDAAAAAEPHDQDAQAALSELLAVVPSARVLLTSTQPLELRSRRVEHYWLGSLPEPAAVALVQDMARCLTWDEARQLVAACGQSPLALRLAASAVAAGALTLDNAMLRARNAAALAAPTPRASPCGSGPGKFPIPPSATSPSVHPSGPSILMPRTLQLVRSLSPAPPSRYNTPGVPAGRPGATPAGAGAGAGAIPTGPYAFAFTRYFTEGSTTGDGSAVVGSPSTTGGGGGGGGAETVGTPSSAITPSPSNIRNNRVSQSFAKSMSFLLRTGGGSGGGGSGGGGGIGQGLQPCYSGQTASVVSSRTYGSGAAVAAALLSGLKDEHRIALVHLSIMPGPWDEDAAAALLGQPPYTVRTLLDVLLGYSLIVSRGCSARGGLGPSLGATMGVFGQGFYSLTPGVLDAARAQLGELDSESRVALECRFVGHVLAQLLSADRLFRQGAVRAAMQLASELRQDVQAMLLIAARCVDPDRMLWRTLSPSRLPALASSSLFSALVLDASAEMEAFWRAVAAHSAEVGDESLAALAARALAATLHKQARYLEAEAAWRGALLQAQRIHGQSSLEAAACHSGLGLALSSLERQREAEEQHQAALSLRKAALGDRHADVATSLSDLARVMRYTSRYREAEAAYKEVLQVRKELLGEDHPAVADTYNSAGIVAGQQKRYLEEEHFYRKALAIRQRTLGLEHPEVAQSLNNIGTALSSQGKHAAAEQVFREALAIKRKVLGPNHHAVGTTLNNIARALRYQSKLPEAEACCRQAIAVLEASLGATHPAVTTAVSNLIFLLKRQGKDAEGAAIYQAYRPRWTPFLGQLGDEAMAVAGATQPRSRPAAAAVAGTTPDSAAAAPGGPRGGGGKEAAAAAVAGGGPAIRPGRPPLAPQMSDPSRNQQQPAGSPAAAAPPPPLPKEQQKRSSPPPKPHLVIDLPLAHLAPGPQGAQRRGGGGGSDGTGGPPELLSRIDATSLHRKTMVEAARMAQRDLQAMGAAASATAEQRTSGSNLRPRTSGALDVRGGGAAAAAAAASNAAAAAARGSAVRSSFRASESGASVAGSGTTEGMNGSGLIDVRSSGGLPPRPYTAAPTVPESPPGRRT